MQESTGFGAAVAAGMAKGIEVWNTKSSDEGESSFDPLIGDDGNELFEIIKRIRSEYELVYFFFIQERRSRYEEWKIAINRCRSNKSS